MIKTVHAMQSYLQKLNQLLHEEQPDIFEPDFKRRVSQPISEEHLHYELSPIMSELEKIQNNMAELYHMNAMMVMQVENLSGRVENLSGCVHRMDSNQNIKNVIIIPQDPQESLEFEQDRSEQTEQTLNQLDTATEMQASSHIFPEQSVQFDYNSLLDASLQSSSCGSIFSKNPLLVGLDSVIDSVAEVKHVVIFDQDVKEPEPVQIQIVLEPEESVSVKEEPVSVKEEPISVKEEPVSVKEEPVQEAEEPVQEEPIQEAEEPVQEAVIEEPIQEPVQEEEEEEEEEEGISLEEIKYNGETYYKDADSFIYKEVNGEIDDTAIGYWKEKTGTIAFYKNKK